MANTDNNAIPRELLVEMEEAARIALSNVRDPQRMQEACERMDRVREENRQKFGIQNIAVDLIREIREEE